MNFDDVAFNAVKKWRSRSYMNQTQETAVVQVLIKDAMCLAIDEAVKVAENCFFVNDNENIVSLEDYIADKIKELK